jgi:magnesium transporter
MLGKALQPEIEGMVRGGRFDELREMLNDALDAADIAEILDDLEDEQKAVTFRLLNTDLAHQVFEWLEPETQEVLIHELSKGQLTSIVNAMSPDDRTRLLEELPGEVSQRLLRSLNPEQMQIASVLLGYPEESIGRLMTPEYVSVRPGMTVAETLAQIRRDAPRAETINVIYVVDEKGRLIDDLRIRQLLVADPDRRIEEIADRQFVALEAHADQEVAIDYFRKYDRVALPVTDSKGVLVGIVTVDDLLDVVEQEQTEDVQKFGGSEALEDAYFAVPLLQLARKRGGWLTVLLLSSFLTVLAMKYFNTVATVLPFLMIFIPMIISTGGNSGSQSAAMLIRGLAVHEVEMADWGRVFLRELFSGLLLGVFLGAIVAGVVALAAAGGVDFEHPESHRMVPLASYGAALPMLICLSITGVVTVGTLVGSMLPFVFKSIGVDPAVCSGPFIATFVDVSGIVIYFSFAQWLFRQLLERA